jgi:DNA modification methylase
MDRQLFYGDNLEMLRDEKRLPSGSVDLCYIDPPFNSKRQYFLIYNNEATGTIDRAQSKAFDDTWTWEATSESDLAFILDIANLHNSKVTPQLVELIRGFQAVLGKGDLLSYLLHLSVRAIEIRRILSHTGSFFLHCDQTAAHYIKLILDAIFLPSGGEFVNEIIWCYSQGGKGKKWFGKKHDNIFWYSKSSDYNFYSDEVRMPLTPHKQNKSGKNYGGRMGVDDDGREFVEKWGTGNKKLYRYYLDEGKIPEDWWTDINSLQASEKERLGYPTQKPEKLLERIIQSASKPGDTVLDVYCGCGTTIAVAERLGRSWIGADITFQSISLILKRLEDTYPDRWDEIQGSLKLDGIPKDLASAKALANRDDDRTRKEFEKWATLTYSSNKAMVNEKKGADGGIDGTLFFMIDQNQNGKAVIQTKSGKVQRNQIATLNSDRLREGAEVAIFITLEPPTKPMIEEARGMGEYKHPSFERTFQRIQIVTVDEIIEGKRVDLPLLRTTILPSAEPQRTSSDTPLF